MKKSDQLESVQIVQRMQRTIISFVDTDSFLVSLHCVDVGSVANISELHKVINDTICEIA
jgi:hypothetical protein